MSIEIALMVWRRSPQQREELLQRDGVVVGRGPHDRAALVARVGEPGLAQRTAA
jgi:hypothetical protein